MFFVLKEINDKNKIMLLQNIIFFSSFFATKNEIGKFGALEMAVKLNAVEGLNHSYDVFCIERSL